MVRPGVQPTELDQFAREYIEAHGGQNAFLGYDGFPATICISVNDTVVHGIPGKEPFKTGDLVGIDAGAMINGLYADAAVTVGLLPITADAERLLEVTRLALEAGTKRALPGRHLGDVQAAIQAVIEAAGFGIIRDLTGHGIGSELHEEPQIPNYGRPSTGPVLKSGMTICLEPMVTLGKPAVFLDQDHWTIRTRDHSLGAQFEHTLLITEREAEILTQIRPWPRLNS
jgi:methionyl aminopeptidase